MVRFYKRMEGIQIDLYSYKTFKQIRELEQILEEAIKRHYDLFLESFKKDLAKLEEVTFKGETHHRKAVLAKRLKKHVKNIDYKAPSEPYCDRFNTVLSGYCMIAKGYVENNPVGYLYYIWKIDYWRDFKEKLDFICRVLEHEEYSHREKKFLLLTYHDFIRYEAKYFYSFADFLKEVLENLQKRMKYKEEYGDRYCFVCDKFIGLNEDLEDHKHDVTGYAIVLIELEE